MTTTGTAISYTRFSSLGQANGDSINRQVKKAEAYAEKHGLHLDQQLSFRDLGVSAFDQSNLKHGSLGLLLQAVKDGRIAVGTTLIVESFDRLSRATPLDALGLFTELLNAGLKVVTVVDEKLYSRETVQTNPLQLLESLIVMFRAHDESMTKSKRVKSAWDAKKVKARSGHVLSRKTPHWIKSDADRTKLELVEERADVVRWLIEQSERGTGNSTLIAMLHERGVAAWSSSGSWQPSYIQKLLTSPALFGGIDLDGEIVRGYYPPVITEDRYHRLQAIRAERATTQCTSGRGKTLSNLFSGRMKCGYCGFPMMISGYKVRASGYERKHVSCSGARIKDPKGCKTMRIWFLDELEDKVLLRLTALDPSKLAGQEKTTIDDAQMVLAGMQARSGELKRKIANVIDAIAEGQAPKTLLDRLKALEDEQDKLEKQSSTQQDIVARLSAGQVNGKDRLTMLMKLFKLLKKPQTDVQLKALRQQLANLIATTLETLTLYPAGPTLNGTKHDRFFTVALKNGDRVDVDDSDDQGEAYRVDPDQLKLAML